MLARNILLSASMRTFSSAARAFSLAESASLHARLLLCSAQAPSLSEPPSAQLLHQRLQLLHCSGLRQHRCRGQLPEGQVSSNERGRPDAGSGRASSQRSAAWQVEEAGCSGREGRGMMRGGGGGTAGVAGKVVLRLLCSRRGFCWGAARDSSSRCCRPASGAGARVPVVVVRRAQP